MKNQPVLLEMEKITKSFPGVKALNGVSLRIGVGEVHALMGENGAGKSTLIKILTGIYAKDSGDIRFEGKSISPASSFQAQQAGISTIYQELNLVPYLSVCENIFLGREPRKRGLIDWKTIERSSEALLTDLGIRVDVRQPLYRQSTAVQQMVAIARAISVRARLVVMDEPTSSLDEKEVRVLFQVIRKLKRDDISVLFVSHRLDEIYEICDRMTILKDGELVGEYAVKDISKIDLVSKMIGRDASSIVHRHKERGAGAVSSEYICRVSRIRRGTKLHDVDLDIRRGEIVGLAGLLGSGRTELAKIMFGADQPDQGDMEVLGRKVKFAQPRDAIREGIGFCSEDRKVEGILPHMSVRDNMTLAALPRIQRFGVISKKKQERIVKEFTEKLAIKTPNAEQMIRNLSGGNQQKVLLARWMCMQPNLIILDEPTRGIDVGAKAEIEQFIQSLAASGVSILMISSDLEELVRSCDRIVVLRDGRKIRELTGKDISPQAIMETIAKGNEAG